MLVRGSLKVIDGGGGCTWFTVWAIDGVCAHTVKEFCRLFVAARRWQWAVAVANCKQKTESNIFIRFLVVFIYFGKCYTMK